MRKLNLAGQKFGRLTAVSEFPERTCGHVQWRCTCECGKEVVVEAGKLRSGHTKSCGCWSREAIIRTHRTHGKTETRAYHIWCAMKARCYNPKNNEYQHYGARGITVCERWLHSFENFYADMGEPFPRATIDRINNNGNYEPGNCRWATYFEQAANTRRSRMITFRGKTQHLSAWARELGIDATLLRWRLKYYSVEQSFTDPVVNHPHHLRLSPSA